jgi:hypothetical protein
MQTFEALTEEEQRPLLQRMIKLVATTTMTLEEGLQQAITEEDVRKLHSPSQFVCFQSIVLQLPCAPVFTTWTIYVLLGAFEFLRSGKPQLLQSQSQVSCDFGVRKELCSCLLHQYCTPVDDHPGDVRADFISAYNRNMYDWNVRVHVLLLVAILPATFVDESSFDLLQSLSGSATV